MKLLLQHLEPHGELDYLVLVLIFLCPHPHQHRLGLRHPQSLAPVLLGLCSQLIQLVCGLLEVSFELDVCIGQLFVIIYMKSYNGGFLLTVGYVELVFEALLFLLELLLQLVDLPSLLVVLVLQVVHLEAQVVNNRLHLLILSIEHFDLFLQFLSLLFSRLPAVFKSRKFGFVARSKIGNAFIVPHQ